MFIIPLHFADAKRIVSLINRALPRSRFTVNYLQTEPYSRGRMLVNVQGVRLKRKKPYCGQHPGPCLALFPRKHMTASYLEGADWVAFDDMLNDILDRYSICANIMSKKMGALNTNWIRKGRRRRVRYDMVDTQPGSAFGPHYGWALADDDDFEDWCGKTAPRSTYPDDTPGIPDWEKKKEKNYAEVFLAHAH